MVIYQIGSKGSDCFVGMGQCESHGDTYFPTLKEARRWIDSCVIADKCELDISRITIPKLPAKQLACLLLDHEGFVEHSVPVYSVDYDPETGGTYKLPVKA